MADVAMVAPPPALPGGPMTPRGARRCLFGPPQNAQALYEAEMKKMLDEKIEKWNFDFGKGRPLQSGRYKWIEVEVGKGALVQKHITDYMRKRKQPSSSCDEGVPETSKKRRNST